MLALQESVSTADTTTTSGGGSNTDSVPTKDMMMTSSSPPPPPPLPKQQPHFHRHGSDCDSSTEASTTGLHSEVAGVPPPLPLPPTTTPAPTTTTTMASTLNADLSIIQGDDDVDVDDDVVGKMVGSNGIEDMLDISNLEEGKRTTTHPVLVPLSPVLPVGHAQQNGQHPVVKNKTISFRNLKKKRQQLLSSNHKEGNNNNKNKNSSSSSSSMSCDTDNGQHCCRNKRPSAIWMGRVLFIGFLCMVAAVLGIGAYEFQKSSEKELAEAQLAAIVDRAFSTAHDITLRKLLGTVTVTSMYSQAFPDAEQWPYVHMKGFHDIVGNVIATSKGRGIAFVPLVLPEQVPSFEEFAYQHLPKNAGTSEFGPGIYSFGTNLNTTDGRYHDVTGITNYGSKYDGMLLPIFQVFNPDPSKPTMYMLNYHSIESRGRAFDSVIQCVEEEQRTHTTISDYHEHDYDEKVNPHHGTAFCGTITFVVQSPTPPSHQVEPGAIIFLPIFPANNISKIVGFIGSSIVWSDVLEQAFNEQVSGIDVVLQTSQSPDVAYTYRVVRGKAYYTGDSDLHDPTYDAYRRTAVLTDVGLHLSENSPTYYMTVYPSGDFFRVFSTENPTVATVGAVSIIIFVSLLFFLYDAIVSKENRKNQAIIEGRRRFMRFVSHEVRTPLNSVCMGLKLLQEEVALMFGKDEGDHREIILPPFLPEAMVFDPTLDGGSNFKYEYCPLLLADKQDKSIVHARRDKANDIFHLSQQVLSSASNAVDVLNDLLNYDKIETGQLQLEKTIISIWSLIEHVVDEFELPFKAKNINFELDFGSIVDLEQSRHSDNKQQAHGTATARSSSSISDMLTTELRECRVVGDSMKITQVLRNILSNALKFTPEGGTVKVQPFWLKHDDDTNTKKVKSSTDEFTLYGSEENVTFDRSGQLLVKVSDSGAGMSKDQVDKLFRAGVQYNSNKLQAGQGSGLGLFIAKSIMEKHGGDLKAESTGIGQGTTFSMSMPIYRIQDTNPVLRQQNESFDIEGLGGSVGGNSNNASSSRSGGGNVEAVRTTPLSRSLHVLVVDDALTNRKLLSRLLEKKGHVCDQAEDGAVAVEKVSQAIQEGRQYDSVLLDYEMPNMDGPTAAQKICAMGCTSLIVGITGNALPGDVAHFKKCGADFVLPKPLNIPDLIRLWEQSGIKARSDVAESNSVGG